MLELSAVSLSSGDRASVVPTESAHGCLNWYQTVNSLKVRQRTVNFPRFKITDTLTPRDYITLRDVDQWVGCSVPPAYHTTPGQCCDTVDLSCVMWLVRCPKPLSLPLDCASTIFRALYKTHSPRTTGRKSYFDELECSSKFSRAAVLVTAGECADTHEHLQIDTASAHYLSHIQSTDIYFFPFSFGNAAIENDHGSLQKDSRFASHFH